MLENIALIKEVHESLRRSKAEEIANSFLKKISLEFIGRYRINQCSLLDIFYIMLIRALMTKELNVIIVRPFAIVTNLEEINAIIDNIGVLNEFNKNIIILDRTKNESLYEGYKCHIVK